MKALTIIITIIILLLLISRAPRRVSSPAAPAWPGRGPMAPRTCTTARPTGPILYSTILYYTILYYTIPYYTIPYYTIL